MKHKQITNKERLALLQRTINKIKNKIKTLNYNELIPYYELQVERCNKDLLIEKESIKRLSKVLCVGK